MSGGGGEGGGKLPSVDHGRRTDEGHDKKNFVYNHSLKLKMIGSNHHAV